jgi:hypothetical protein
MRPVPVKADTGRRSLIVPPSRHLMTRPDVPGPAAARAARPCRFLSWPPVRTVQPDMRSGSEPWHRVGRRSMPGPRPRCTSLRLNTRARCVSWRLTGSAAVCGPGRHAVLILRYRQSVRRLGSAPPNCRPPLGTRPRAWLVDASVDPTEARNAPGLGTSSWPLISRPTAR